MASKGLPPMLDVPAQPYAFSFPTRNTALILIDMQRDFLLPDGFGHIQGGDLAAVQASIEPTKKLLDLFRGAGMHVFHTREGHKPDLSDCPSSKLIRQAAHPENKQHGLVIGDKGKMGRLLIQGEYGHDLIDELQPIPGEVVIDKPGKGAFWNTRLMEKLKAKAITHLVVGGVTTECCFAGTIREANDRGFECCGVTEATAGYNAAFKVCSLEMLHWSQGLFGFVGSLSGFEDALSPYQSSSMPSSEAVSTPPQTPPVWDGDISISALNAGYRKGLSPVTVIEALYKKIQEYHQVDPAVWIHLVPEETALAAVRALLSKHPDRKSRPPLFGIPFSIKDSIDIKGLFTTTACPPLAFIPSKSAVVYEKVIEQGAILIGKTNLDQLATGLSGCRSPYGITKSVFNKNYISGGSSSGNAVSVGAGLVSFSLATDTAGSGRVPAAFNGVVGFKPTRGTISAQGVTPACLSLDCVALMARNVPDCRYVWEICEGYDDEYLYAKPTPPNLRHVNSLGPQAKAFTFGIPPPEALKVCTPVYRRMFEEAVKTLQSIGGVLVDLDWSPFDKAGKLLYEGTFVSERLASLPDGWFEENQGHLHPVIRDIFEAVTKRNSTAVQAYRDLQAKALYTREAERIFASSKVGPFIVVVPSTPMHWTVTEMLADPIAKNTALGQFTHFGNVLDLTGVSVPAGTYPLSELVSPKKETGVEKKAEAEEKTEVEEKTDVEEKTEVEPTSEKKDDKAESEGREANGEVPPSTKVEAKESVLPFAVTLIGGSRTDAEVLEVARRFEEAVKAKARY